VDPAAGDAFGGDSAAKCASETAGAGAGAGAAVGAAVDDRVTTGIEGHWLNDKPGASSEKSKMECALAPAVGAWGGGRGGCGAGFGPNEWWKRGIRLADALQAKSEQDSLLIPAAVHNTPTTQSLTARLTDTWNVR
jgi:hypothetical protein